jgi:hypothetical protein
VVGKIRSSRSKTGKRGGGRESYFDHDAERPLHLLMGHAKARQEDLTPDEKRTVRKEIGKFGKEPIASMNQAVEHAQRRKVRGVHDESGDAGCNGNPPRLAHVATPLLP